MSAQVSAAEWQRIKTLFLLALETPPADRDALLAREAAGDANLLREVQSLLASHEQQGAPQFLNVLRVLDVPQALGLVTPRPLRIVIQNPADFQATQTIYQAAGADQVLAIATPKERED